MFSVLLMLNVLMLVLDVSVGVLLVYCMMWFCSLGIVLKLKVLSRIRIVIVVGCDYVSRLKVMRISRSVDVNLIRV